MRYTRLVKKTKRKIKYVFDANFFTCQTYINMIFYMKNEKLQKNEKQISKV